MISYVNPKCTEAIPPHTGRIGLTVLNRLVHLGFTPSGTCLEAAGQAKYLARFVLAAAQEISDLVQIAAPVMKAARAHDNDKIVVLDRRVD